MFEISSAQRREFRARAHTLHPVVSIAENGLSASVLKEIEHSLNAHELIKIRVYSDDRDQRVAMYAELCEKLACAPIQHIGKLFVIFRPSPEPEVAKTKSAPTTRRPAGRNGAAKKTLSSKLGARTAGLLKRSIAKAKRSESSNPSRDPAKPRALANSPSKPNVGAPGTRRTHGTTVKPVRSSTVGSRSAAGRGPKR